MTYTLIANLWFIILVVLALVGYFSQRQKEQASQSSEEREAALDNLPSRTTNATMWRRPETPEEWKRYEEAKRLLKQNGYIT